MDLPTLLPSRWAAQRAAPAAAGGAGLSRALAMAGCRIKRWREISPRFGRTVTDVVVLPWEFANARESLAADTPAP
jgi:hypothetical protein